LLASPPEGARGLCFTLCVRRLRCACLTRLRKARPNRRVGPPSSAAQSTVLPSHRRPLPEESQPHPSQPTCRRPTCQSAALSSAHEQKKTAQFGRAALSFDASASQLRSSLTIYKATPSGHPLAPDSARVSSC